MTTIPVAHVFQSSGVSLSKLAKDCDSVATRARGYPTTIQFENLSVQQIVTLMNIVADGNEACSVFSSQMVKALLARLPSESEVDEEFYSEFVVPDSEMTVEISQVFTGGRRVSEVEFVWSEISDEILPRIAFLADQNGQKTVELRWRVTDQEPNLGFRDNRWELVDSCLRQFSRIQQKLVLLPVISTTTSFQDDVHPSLRRELIGWCAIREQLNQSSENEEETAPQYIISADRINGILDRLDPEIACDCDIPSNLCSYISRAQLFEEFCSNTHEREKWAIRSVEGFLIIVSPKSNTKTLSQDLSALELAEVDLTGSSPDSQRLTPIELISVNPSIEVVHQLLSLGDVAIDDDTLNAITHYIKYQDRSALEACEVSGCTLRFSQTSTFATGMALQSILEEEVAEAEEEVDEEFSEETQEGENPDDEEVALVDQDYLAQIVCPSKDGGKHGFIFTFREALPERNEASHNVRSDEHGETEPDDVEGIELRIERVGGASSGFLDFAILEQMVQALGEKLPRKLKGLKPYNSDGGLCAKLSPSIKIALQVRADPLEEEVVA